MQKISPFLWFDSEALEAARFYISIFKNSRIGAVGRSTAGASAITGRPPGSVMAVEFELDGHRFTAFNGGRAFALTEAVSFLVSCRTQGEVDEFWERLSADGAKGQCGWVKDKFGISWQILPAELDDMLSDGNRERAKRVMAAMLKMSKIDIGELQRAFHGG